MSRPAIFTQSDVSKVLKGAKAAGVELSRLEIDRQGNIVAHIGKPEEDGHDAGGEWSERIRAKRKRATALRN